MKPPSLTVVILTYNEELHLERCIRSVQPIAERVVVVDSYSTDRTLEIAQSLGAEVFQNPFVHQAQQFQWALDNIPIASEWVMRMDADEYVLPELVEELREKLPSLPLKVTGLYVKLRLIFLEKWIKRGYYPMVLLRIWRNGAAYVEQKWMDEHTRLKYGKTIMLEQDLADHNLNHLGWWTEKHNRYSIREAAERLNAEYHFWENGEQAKVKRHKRIYLRLPLFLRPFLYFFYRYFFRLGFLEGKSGLIWHVLQGFWFQFLVDAKIFQIKHLAKKQGKSVRQILTEDFGVKL